MSYALIAIKIYILTNSQYIWTLQSNSNLRHYFCYPAAIQLYLVPSRSHALTPELVPAQRDGSKMATSQQRLLKYALLLSLDYLVQMMKHKTFTRIILG